MLRYSISEIGVSIVQVDLLKKGLKGQAQTYMDISFNYQALFNAQLQLAEMLCFENSTPTEILEELTERNGITTYYKN